MTLSGGAGMTSAFAARSTPGEIITGAGGGSSSTASNCPVGARDGRGRGNNARQTGLPEQSTP